jgi:hypothetical protein
LGRLYLRSLYFHVAAPELWSPESPHLYRCRVTLSSSAGEMHLEERFGIRQVEFVEHGPFKLNGKRVLLRGTQRHADHAGVAAAMSDDLVREEMQLIREMGANFIRLAHYQQDRLVLDLCDELGLMVWEEVPWCRAGIGSEGFKRNAQDMLAHMIDQHYNHPSIILWGLGNEDDWPNEQPSVDEPAIRAFMTEMRDLAHQLDSSRLTSFRRCDFARDIPDVYSPSIWAGWYRGNYREYEQSLLTERSRVERFVHIEWGADSQAGRHSEDPEAVLRKVATGNGTDERGLDYLKTGGDVRVSRDGDWSESYACNLFDWHLKTQETLDWLTGSAQWVFKDFASPLRDENGIPRVNQKGVVERDLTKKESYFVFQSYWAEKPMAHIYGHSWPVRWGKPGEKRNVQVYSNCERAELFLNGESLGALKRDSQNFPAAGLRWEVVFATGPNRLRTIAVKGEAIVTDEIDLIYQTEPWDKPAQLKLSEKARKSNLVTVEAMLFDAKGVLCLDSSQMVQFALAGAGTLQDNLGHHAGLPRTPTVERARRNLSGSRRSMHDQRCAGGNADRIFQSLIAGASSRCNRVRRLRFNSRRMAMTLHTPLNTRHSERESAARTTIKESRSMNFIRQTSGFVRASAAAALVALMALCMLPGLIPGAGVAYAQNTNATISGQVFDPAGSLVPFAQVLVVNQDTGVAALNGKSDSAGAFVAAQVIPGTYRITVSAPGLKTTVIDNLQATVAQVTTVVVKMQIGIGTESVIVYAKGEQLDAGTSDISTLIAPSDVQNLPLQDRATENLLAFIPGVAHGGAGDTPSTSQLSINGSRTLNTEVLLNGVSTIIASTGTPGTLPSPDGVDSFRVLTTNAPSEYGRTSGAVITVNTVSGTNAYHGNVYFLVRNEAMDANSYFNKLTINSTTGAVTPRARDRFYQPGGSVGGPVRIPHFYNGHDKTFFFVNYDHTISPSTTNLAETVPTAVQRAGDLSAALATTGANGQPRTPQNIYQPTGKTSPAFANNQVGPIDPAAKAILALLPLPNTVGTYDLTDNRYTNNWTSQQTFNDTQTKFVARVDEVVTPSDRLIFNVYRYTTSTPNAVTYGVPLLNTTWLCTCNNAWLPSVDYTRVWSPTLVMDLNMGFFRNVVIRVPPGLSSTAAQQLGIASLPLSQTPEITDPGISSIGPATNTDQINITNTFTPFGTITKTWGPHTLKAGASLRKNEFNSFNPATYPDGLFAFDGSITNHGASGNPNTGIADFLLGRVKTAQYEQVQPETGRRNYNLGVFLQDDWKFNSKLNLNLGVRYEYEAPLTIATNIYSRIDPATGVLLAAGINGTSDSLNIVTPKENFSPRIGAAYSFDNKTVIRAAFGTFYGTIFQNLGGQLAYPGFDNTISYNNLGTAVPQPFSLSQGMPIQPASNLNAPFGPVQAATASNPYSPAISFNNQNHMPLVQQWNFGVERQLPLSLTMEVNYVGNHAVHLSYNLNENVVPLASVPAVTLANTSLATQDALQFPTLKGFTTNNDIGKSNYNALQASVRRQFNTRLAVLSNYTYAKSLDDGTTIYNFSAPNGTANSQYPVDNPNKIDDYAVSNIDTKHTLNIAAIYTTPGPWWLRDWHISPVFLGRTGLPLNITQSGEIPGASQRPNGNPQLLKLPNHTLNGAALQYFDSATDPNFPLTASGPVYNTIGGVRTQIVPTGFGGVPRDSNREPGEIDFDASVSKDFKLYEWLNFRFRMDAFNVINHTNFGTPSGSLSVTETGTTATFGTSTGFGKITGTQNPRQMQASARFFF